jgi:hypothetical protein
MLDWPVWRWEARIASGAEQAPQMDSATLSEDDQCRWPDENPLCRAPFHDSA